MVFESLAKFEDGLLGGWPSFPAEARDYIAERADQVVSLVRSNPELLKLPHGYKVFSEPHRYSYDPDWQELNALAKGMDKIGFRKHRKHIQDAFPEWLGVKKHFQKNTEADDKDISAWAWANTLSELALYVVHVMNIYSQEKSLLLNLYSTNIKEDALGRTNYKPTISAFSKVVRKNLGWKADSAFQSDVRSELLISIVEIERRKSSARPDRSGIEFEKVCERALLSSGFDVETTPSTGDFGADLIAEKDGLRFAIQCKDLSKPVGVKGVQEAVAAKRHYQTDFACVVCDAGFTDAAVELATTNRVIISNARNITTELELAR